MDLTVERPTRAYLDFVQGVKGQSARELIPALVELYNQKVASREAPAPSNFREVAPLMQDEPMWKFYELLNNHSQHMMWDGVLEIVGKNAATIHEQLGKPVPGARGSLTLNPDIELPRYYRDNEFHLRPGGMWNGEAQGFYTDIANWVYFAGSNNNRESQGMAVAGLPERDYKRILDLACGIGQSTWPLARRFPNAEIHGCDLSAPLLTYAHHVAEEMGLPIHYAQYNAEKTGYPDNHFDLVLAYILFHEIPNGAARNVIREVYRILEPGGTFALADIRPYSQMQPIRAFISDFQTYGNGESFWRSHGLRDFPALFEEAGFVNFRQVNADPSRPQTLYLAEKPA